HQLLSSLRLTSSPPSCLFLSFFPPTATTAIYTLSLHDALPICAAIAHSVVGVADFDAPVLRPTLRIVLAVLRSVLRDRVGFTIADRKSTRLNSSHVSISYAVFCLKKKKQRPSRSIATAQRDQPS